MINLNETPVRTSKNFNINNISLENFEIPKRIEQFKNIQINSTNKNIIIDENCTDLNLKYTLGEFFLKQINEQSNKKMNIIIDSKTEEVFEIGFKLDKLNSSLVENIEITANEDTKGIVVLKYQSEDSCSCYHNGVVRVNAKKNSNINLVLINLLNCNSQNFISMQNNIEENAKLEYTIVDFGGKASITNYYSNLLGFSAENKLNSIYLGTGNQLFDLNYIGELKGEKSSIDIEVQGALKDNSKKHFKGTIDFKKGCKKAKGNENESCMLLSDTAKSIALPMLLCSEEDVEGNHSTSAGKVGEKELFYIMSRGFSFKEAMKLMVKAKFNKILDTIKNEELKNEILEEIENRLN